MCQPWTHRSRFNNGPQSRKKQKKHLVRRAQPIGSHGRYGACSRIKNAVQPRTTPLTDNTRYHSITPPRSRKDYDNLTKRKTDKGEEDAALAVRRQQAETPQNESKYKKETLQTSAEDNHTQNPRSLPRRSPIAVSLPRLITRTPGAEQDRRKGAERSRAEPGACPPL
jgi:hypothetical protein